MVDVFTRGAGDLSVSQRRALLVCVASCDGLVEPVLHACDVLDLAPDALEGAEGSGLVTLAGSLVFRHPLVRHAVYTAATVADRRATHRALAEANTESLEQRALHLAAAAVGSDEAVASLLDGTAAEAVARGDAAAAADLLTRAADLTPSTDDRAQRRMRAAEAAVLVGQSERAVGLLTAAAGEASAAVSRGRVAHLQSRLALLGSLPYPDAVSALESAATDLAELSPTLSLTLRAEALTLGLLACAADRMVAVQELHRLAEHLGGRDPEAARTWAELARAVAVEPDERVPLSDLTIESSLVPRGMSAVDTLHRTIVRAKARLLAEDTVGCREVLTRMILRSRTVGELGALPLPLALLGEAAFLDGDWGVAQQASAEAVDLAALTDQLTSGLHAATVQALVAAGRGLDEECRRTVPGAMAVARALGTSAPVASLIWAQGLLELGAGHLEAAAHRLRAAGAQVAEGAAHARPGVVRWRADLVEATAAMGLLDEAEHHTGALEEEAHRSSSAYGRAAAARCRGILSVDEDLDKVFAGAAASHTHHRNPFEMARLHLCWGRRLVAAGRSEEARPQLHEALAGFQQLAAEGWAERTWEALTATGVQRPRTAADVFDMLTDRQRSISWAAARGATEQEIAHELHLGRATVRRELSAVQFQLGVSATQELGDRLAEAGIVERRSVPRHPAPAVTVLGGFEVQIGGRQVAGLSGLPARAVQAVAAHGGRMDTEELVELLWPERPEGTGRARLRNILWRTQEIAGPLLQRDGTSVRFADGVAVDAAIFDVEAKAALAAPEHTAVRASLAARAVDRYTGPLLAGHPLESWVGAARERLRRRYLILLDLLVNAAADEGDVAGAIALLERAIEADPDDESRYLTAARFLHGQGRTAAACNYLTRIEVITEELHLPPSQPFRALREQLHGVADDRRTGGGDGGGRAGAGV